MYETLMKSKKNIWKQDNKRKKEKRDNLDLNKK